MFKYSSISNDLDGNIVKVNPPSIASSAIAVLVTILMETLLKLIHHQSQAQQHKHCGWASHSFADNYLQSSLDLQRQFDGRKNVINSIHLYNEIFHVGLSKGNPQNHWFNYIILLLCRICLLLRGRLTNVTQLCEEKC
ncbi:CLUMA_CG005815, isoform A [Clunio marinus]|uniref:CLUMA_CG005815, isoform A n=1 Tax=Clunio marinus TaxID=568069 RepID=A0A1J1HXJ4_9DIPT|nr:CLUMA_CG005815, isoform A [Clunio marinus]